jgi:hypothetical protein
MYKKSSACYLAKKGGSKTHLTSNNELKPKKATTF